MVSPVSSLLRRSLLPTVLTIMPCSPQSDDKPSDTEILCVNSFFLLGKLFCVQSFGKRFRETRSPACQRLLKNVVHPLDDAVEGHPRLRQLAEAHQLLLGRLIIGVESARALVFDYYSNSVWWTCGAKIKGDDENECVTVSDGEEMIQCSRVS